jgi:hypothetical protein
VETAGQALAVTAPTGGRRIAVSALVICAAVVCGGASIALVSSSEQYDDQALWAC